MTDTEKTTYLEFAKQLALDAGEIMRKYFLHTETEWKEDSTPLTIADTTINRMVIERIAEAFPDHSVLGEEESAMRDGAKYTWVCDPVDGTMPYSHGLPISTFSLALCDDGKPVVGVVYDPFMMRMFSATNGGGAYCNDEKMHVSDSRENLLISIDAFPSTNPVVNADSSIRDLLHAKGMKTVTMWSAILPACLVAQGQFGGSILNIPAPQDPAAIKVIIEEAGGKVTDLFGNDQRYDQPTKGFIASNGIIHDELVKMVQEATHGAR